ncbi:hypothetical protein Ddc_14221 [Ditylenchus destructor]|nr:hypothetical protein Ddc_14221 [Ditylenchus destructor]
MSKFSMTHLNFLWSRVLDYLVAPHLCLLTFSFKDRRPLQATNKNIVVGGAQGSSVLTAGIPITGEAGGLPRGPERRVHLQRKVSNSSGAHLSRIDFD